MNVTKDLIFDISDDIITNFLFDSDEIQLLNNVFLFEELASTPFNRFDLKQTTPLNKIDLQFFVKLRDGTTKPIFLEPGEDMDITISFFKNSERRGYDN